MKLDPPPHVVAPAAALESPEATAEQSLRPRVAEILEKVLHYNPSADVALVERAFVAAARAHAGQYRKSGEPYLVHPLGVTAVIADLKLDVPSLCAGLLHDCVEDTEMTVEQVAAGFSPAIAALVDGVTKLGRLPWNTREERQAENFRKMLVAMAEDIRVILIKLADRTDNMRTLGHVSEERQERTARETLEIYAPLANRLGIHWLRAELEDLAFRYLYPNEYRALIDALAASAEERRAYTAQVEGILRQLMSDNDLACEVCGRAKNLWGIYAKMRRTQRTLNDIHDVVAFRVVTHSIRDCYAALGVVHEHFTPIPGRFKDYVAMPKPNQYQSLHTSLIGPRGERLEVQIRTTDMQRVAEEGVAAHWVYKEGASLLSNDDQQKFAWLRQLVEFQRDLHDPAEFIDAVKIDLFSDEVYVFTPKGDVKALPAGATPIDFAFAIHTEVGLHCTGAKVNGHIVPLRYRLRNGDTVEIVTNPKQKPSKDWLKFCATARARAKIRHFIRRERRERGRALGWELLERALRAQGHSLSKLEKDGQLDQAAVSLHVGNRAEELLMQVGFGKVTPIQVVRTLLPETVVEEPPEPATNRLISIFRKARRRPAPSGIRVQGEDDVLVRFAQCCHPLPGDAIMGFITRGRGVTVHKLDCSKALDLDPERRIEVAWDSAAKVEHAVKINVHATDKPGLLAEMTRAFSEQGVNIAQANCRVTATGRAINTFHVQVAHLDHLKQVMRAIKKIKGVYSVDRL
ncbi:MAG: bifunctional (p)ppGpp synthetase/guanosine-3',5'-bis(diphosphate) 3'-pyrophosphohydrolase [Proteobacteria bacterium]|nr:bifunctional (p)ppGpp synthetase/guanosine-3',5'-bis(diphosphate) 3'-pyrophosphohydrolase [Pseudomonadota bacterium]